MTRSMSSGSMFPPESTTTVLPVAETAPWMIAATPAAPAGSTTSFARSRRMTSARAISSSLTVTTSSTNSATSGNVMSPGRATAMPSAIVGWSWIVVGSPAASEGGNAAAFAACTPITRIVRPSSAALSLSAVATPEASPPPPIASTTVSTSGTWSRISRPSVPLPRHDVGVVEGGDEHRPVLGGPRLRRLVRLVEDVARELHVGAVVARRLELRERGPDGHEDRRPDAELAGRERDALCVVACGGGHDARGLLRVGELREAVVRAADLVRAGPLEVLALQEDLAAEDLADRARLLHRRDVDDRGDPHAGGLEIGERRGRERGRHSAAFGSTVPSSTARRGADDAADAAAGAGVARRFANALATATSGTAKSAPGTPAT